MSPQLLRGCKFSSSCVGLLEVRLFLWVFQVLFTELGLPLAPWPSSYPPPRLRKMAFSHLPFHSPVVQRSYTMTPSKAAHALGVRLLWSLDSMGSLVSISHYSTPVALVSDLHRLSCVSQHTRLAEAGEGAGPWAAPAQRSCCLLEGLAQSLGSLTSLLTQNNPCRARGFTLRLHRCCCTKNRWGGGFKKLNQDDRNRNGKVYNTSTWHRGSERQGKL